VKQNRTSRAAARILILGAGIAVAGHATAQTLISDVTYQYLGNNFAGTTIPADPNAAYSSLASIGAGRAPGGGSGTPPRTLVQADDFLAGQSFVGQRVQAIRFIMWNAGGGTGAPLTQGSLQLGFWLSDGAGGLPGTYLNESSRLIGFTTPLHTFDLGATVMTLNLGSAGFTIGSGRLWTGFAWEGVTNPPANQGTAGSLGYVVGGSPTVGHTNAGGILSESFGIPFGQALLNPASSQNYGPFAMEFIVPAPSGGVVVLAAGGIALIRRRRR